MKQRCDKKVMNSLKNVELYGYLSILLTTRNLLDVYNLDYLLCKLSRLFEDMEHMSL